MDISKLLNLVQEKFSEEFKIVTETIPGELTARKLYNKCDEILSMLPHHVLHESCEEVNSFILYNRFVSYPTIEQGF